MNTAVISNAQARVTAAWKGYWTLVAHQRELKQKFPNDLFEGVLYGMTPDVDAACREIWAAHAEYDRVLTGETLKDAQAQLRDTQEQLARAKEAVQRKAEEIVKLVEENNDRSAAEVRALLALEAERAKAPDTATDLSPVTKAAEKIGLEKVDAVSIAKWIFDAKSELGRYQNTLCDVRKELEAARNVKMLVMSKSAEWIMCVKDTRVDAELTPDAARARAFARSLARVGAELDAYGIAVVDDKGDGLDLDQRLRLLAAKAGFDVSTLPPTVAEFQRFWNQHKEGTIPPKAKPLPYFRRLLKPVV